MSRLLPRKLELRDGPGGGHAEDEIQRNGDRRRDKGQLDRRERVGIVRRRRSKRRQPLRNASAKIAASGMNRKKSRNARATAMSSHAQDGRSVAAERRATVVARKSANDRGHRLKSVLRAAVVHRCRRLIASRRTNEAIEHDHRDGGRARVVILLELGDDQERHDLRAHRHVAGNENNRSVFSEGARKSEGKAG